MLFFVIFSHCFVSNVSCIVRNDKIFIRSSTVTSIVATENWIIKVTNYHVQLAHQSDTALIATKVSLLWCSLATNKLAYIDQNELFFACRVIRTTLAKCQWVLFNMLTFV